MRKMIKKIDIENMSHSDWLLTRRDSIGGSEISALMLQSKWSTPLDVYNDKLGLSEPIEVNDSMFAGIYLEDGVANMFASKHLDLKVSKSPYMFIDEERPWLSANVDRILEHEDGTQGILEIKTTSSWNSKTWTTDVPYSYYCQLQHYLGILNLDFGYVAILIDGREFRHFSFIRDDELIATMRAAAYKFWHNNVLLSIPPEASNDDDLKALYPDTEAGSRLEADIIDIVNVKGYLESVKEETLAKAKKDQYKFKIKKSMMAMELLVDNEVIIARLKKNKAGHRILTVVKQKDS